MPNFPLNLNPAGLSAGVFLGPLVGAIVVLCAIAYARLRASR